MSFFDSEIVQSEMKEIQSLQEKVYSNVFSFANMNARDKREHIDALEQLLDRQQVLYARVSLSDDPQAQAMKKDIVDSASMVGLTKDTDLGLMFSHMKKAIHQMREALDKPGSHW